MKTVLIAALMVLQSGASTSSKHHHQHRHHGHGSHKHDHQTLSQTGHNSKAFHSKDFFKHRNMLNEREHSNVQMYDTLNDKLTDEQFIGQVIDNEKNNVKNATLIQVNANEKGPFDRDNNPFEQFRFGPSTSLSSGPFDRTNNPFEQFRTPPNAGPIMFNTTSRKSSSRITTTSKTVTTSSSSFSSSNYVVTKTKYQLTEGFEAVKCADEGQVCSCLGQVHFGKKADSFSAMHDSFVSIFDTREGARGYVNCDASSFNNTGGLDKGGNNCYCVREMAPTPLPQAQHCANDAGLEFCSCFGTVFYGQRSSKETGKDMSFAEMMKGGWTSKISNGDLLCDQNSFDGDPVYGHDKQCFCQADPTYEPGPPVEHCANENEECICQGTVYFGRKLCPFDNVVIDFMEMQDFGYSSRDVQGGIGCNSFEFQDPAHGAEKQCFCEANTAPQVKRCASQDGTCTCHGGNIYFGLLELDGKSPISFDEMMEGGDFAYKWDVNGDFPCNAHTFGRDPQPGKAKQCICDDIGYEDFECINEQLEYWKSVKQTTTIQSQISSSWSSSSTTYSSSSSTTRSSSTRIMEEETRFSMETEQRLKIQEEERLRIQRDLEIKMKMEFDSMVGLEKQAHQEEMDMLKAEQDQKEADLKAETLKKEAEAADELSKYQKQLIAQKAAAEAADKKREAEFLRQKAEADAAKLKKMKMKSDLEEKNTLAQMELQSVRTARQAKIRAEKQKMRLESQKLLEEYEANRAATEEARTKEALTKQLEEAMAHQRELALERSAEQQEIREKKNLKKQKEWEQKQRLAKEQEEKQMEIERLRELEIEKLHNETLAQKEKEAELEKQKKEEEEKIKKQEADAVKHQREIEAQQLRALRAQAIASSEADIKEAQELADKLADELEETRKYKQKLLDHKRELALEVEKSRATHEQLILDQEKAKKQLELSKSILEKKKSFSQKMKKETVEFVQKMKKQMDETKKAAEEKMSRLRKEGEEARVKREAAAKASREADEKEHQASLDARKKLEVIQQEQHKREMEAKKAEFEKTFKHIWGAGATGLSIVYATFDNKEEADRVITEVFKDTMISQVTNYADVTYQFKNETKLHIANPGLHVRTNDARVEMITSDDRIPELIETCIAVTQNDNLDIVVVQMNGISPDYSKWVALQSTEQDQTSAYYNVDPYSEIKPIVDKKVPCKADYCPCPK